MKKLSGQLLKKLTKIASKDPVGIIRALAENKKSKPLDGRSQYHSLIEELQQALYMRGEIAADSCVELDGTMALE